MNNIWLKRKLKSVIHQFHFHKKKHKDIYIFTLPRTGSTLLAEILNVSPNIQMISEPFSLDKYNEKILTKNLQNVIPRDRYVDITDYEKNAIFNYLSKLSLRKIPNIQLTDVLKGKFHFITNQTIFKTHRITYLFDEFSNNNEIYILYLLRHPISHSLSRITIKTDDYTKEFFQAKKIQPNLNQHQIILIKQIIDTGSDLEKFTLSWCLENYIFLKKMINNELPANAIPVFYEELVLKPETVIQNLCNKTNLKYTGKMSQTIDIPSKGTIHSSEQKKDLIINKKISELIHNWRNIISSYEEKKVFKVLEKLDIDVYLPGSDLPNKKYLINV